MKGCDDADRAEEPIGTFLQRKHFFQGWDRIRISLGSSHVGWLVAVLLWYLCSPNNWMINR
jgi:hypothetical protein